MAQIINLKTSVIIDIFNHANEIRKKSGDEQAFIYVVGCYATHTKKNCLLREYWANMRQWYNEGLIFNQNCNLFFSYYDMSCRMISYLFGHYAWQYTLSIDVH